LDSKKTYKDEEGNDVILIGSASKEEIELKMRQQKEKFKKTVEKLREILYESKSRLKGEDYNERMANDRADD
jgi:hypothetical protein